MAATLHFLIAPFCMCIILVGIHCYFGLHVLARGVIFVDLSLAQVAALGSTIALLFGLEHHDGGTYFISLGSTFLAASVFALARKNEKLFPQEAIIGITFALATGAIILVVDRLAHGAEHIKESMVGQVLWVTWPEVIKTAVIYSAVAIVHYIFRKKFIQSSFEPHNTTSFVWDFLFYALFGVVITSSVNVAGVLMVFSFLIVPSLLSGLFYKSITAKLIFGWILGVVLSFAGLALSFAWDVPAGALIVVLFTVLPILVLVLMTLFKKLKPAS